MTQKNAQSFFLFPWTVYAYAVYCSGDLTIIVHVFLGCLAGLAVHDANFVSLIHLQEFRKPSFAVSQTLVWNV